MAALYRTGLGGPSGIFALCGPLRLRHAPGVSHEADPIEGLWQEYAAVFRGFDDLTLARWMSQTLAQLHGQLWRASHPLVGAFRLAAMVSHERQIWHQRLVNAPVDFPSAECCRAPLLPMVTRDVLEAGFICLHCNGTAVALEDVPEEAVCEALAKWAEQYAPVHGVAHWEDQRRSSHASYDQALESAAGEGEQLLARLGTELTPPLLEHYPAVIWDDQDECLGIRPEDIMT
jgi:hypothetical protein